MTIHIHCNKCGLMIDTILIDERTSWDYLEYWRKPENHLCNGCWTKSMKSQYKLLNVKKA